jgi:hypothetical protein
MMATMMSPTTALRAGAFGAGPAMPTVIAPP